MRIQKDPIRLRQRLCKDGSKSLYLDIYMNGVRRYEYLKLYLIPEKNAKDKQKNRETLRLAEAVRARKIVELQNGRFGFSVAEDRLNTPFLPYFQKIVDRKRLSGTMMFHNYAACLNHLKKYCRESTTFRDVDEKFCEGFSEYLQTRARKLNTKADKPISRNAQHLYWTKFKSVMIQAKKDRIIQNNPTDRVEGISAEESERTYLTIEELRKMAKTECEYPDVKRAFLFSCLTGLRKSDVLALTWGELSKIDGMWRITFRQIKTNGMQYLDISDEARSYLGEQGDAAGTDKIFNWYYSDKTNMALREWAQRSGVDKHISYHSSRHTFALLLLNNSTDIYTVSRLMGHTSVRTTQIYSHILDSKKQAAIRSLPKINLPDEEDSKK